MYEVTKVSEYPVVLLKLSGAIETESIHAMFSEFIGYFQEIEGVSSLVIDFSDVAAIDEERFAQTLMIFQRTSPTFKFDAPIYYALVGKNSISHAIAAQLEHLKFQIPIFKGADEAISYLNLRIGSTYLKQTIHRSDTNQLETLHIAGSNSNSDLASNGILPGTATFPHGGVLRIEDADTKQQILLFPKDEILVGRQDISHKKPELDLSMWGAFHKGVSREHARIARTEDHALYLVDLHSGNGTWLNGERIEAGIPYLLRDGDRVTFGVLSVHIYYQNTIIELNA